MLKSRYYVDKERRRKSNAIYCPAFDRFLLTDYHDFSVTLKTAQILSSKVASTVYVYARNSDMTNENCLDYGLENKTEEKKGGTSSLYSGQLPIVQLLNSDIIGNLGWPVDYETDERREALHNLKNYAHFVHRMSYAITLSQMTRGFYDNQSFSREFFPAEWLQDRATYVDTSELEHGLFNEIKKTLYFSNTIEEAKKQIDELWVQKGFRMNTIKDKFYEMYEEQFDYAVIE